jgi:hypothetical protein
LQEQQLFAPPTMPFVLHHCNSQCTGVRNYMDIHTVAHLAAHGMGPAEGPIDGSARTAGNQEVCTRHREISTHPLSTQAATTLSTAMGATVGRDVRMQGTDEGAHEHVVEEMNAKTTGDNVAVPISRHEKRTKKRALPDQTDILPLLTPAVEVMDAEDARMKSENDQTLCQDTHIIWYHGVQRFCAERKSASMMLSWIVGHTSRTTSVVTTNKLRLDGFHNWHAVHAGSLDDTRQQQHTFMITRSQRRCALQTIPGLSNLVDNGKAKIMSMQLHDTPEKLEWLNAHILNQGDVNARFEWHQDTNEERKNPRAPRDRRVLYSAIVKLNRGGCTSMQVCGQPEVHYLSPSGSGVIFRSNLHHRTEKAEPGIWKLAMFYGVFL